MSIFLDHPDACCQNEFTHIAQFLDAKGDVGGDLTTQMLAVWEGINQMESNVDAVGDEDDSLVVSPDAFAVCCFQNGLYVHPSVDLKALVDEIRKSGKIGQKTAGQDEETEEQEEGAQDWRIQFRGLEGCSGSLMLNALDRETAVTKFENLGIEDIQKTFAFERSQVYITNVRLPCLLIPRSSTWNDFHCTHARTHATTLPSSRYLSYASQSRLLSPNSGTSIKLKVRSPTGHSQRSEPDAREGRSVPHEGSGF